jgi:biopolymer transport protein TolQ
MKADVVVKTVMIGLLLASIWSWAIILDKWLGISALKAKTRKDEEAFWAGQSVEGMDDRPMEQIKEPMPRVLAAASREWREARRSTLMDPAQASSLGVRAERLMQAAITREVSVLERGLGTLATIGTASPFIGLFGTVWGIMNAFRAIGAQGNPTLQTVAPPIAEALFATGIGLFAAIPAVIFYNKFSGDISAYTTRLEIFADEVWVRLSRRLSDGAPQTTPTARDPNTRTGA